MPSAQNKGQLRIGIESDGVKFHPFAIDLNACNYLEMDGMMPILF
jgi:hypothetical protein